MNKSEPRKRICSYHLCENKHDKTIYCKYCGKYYCEEHIEPAPPRLPNFDNDSEFSEWKFFSKNHHPCIEYPKYEAEKREEERRKIRELMDETINSKTKSETNYKLNEEIQSEIAISTQDKSYDICSYCFPRGDKDKKEVVQCEYCNEWFCEEHASPKKPMAAPFKTKDRCEKIEWDKKGGHPCVPYFDYVTKYGEGPRFDTSIFIEKPEIGKTPILESPVDIKKISEITEEQEDKSDEKTIPEEIIQPAPEDEFIKKCSFCSVKSDDLAKCSYCNQLFCRDHLEPKTSHDFLRTNGGHSCKQFTDQKKEEQKPTGQRIKISEPSRSIKQRLHYLSNRFVGWFLWKKHPRSRLRKENFFIYLIVAIVLSLFFMIIYSYSNELNTIIIGFIKFGAFIQICLIIPIIWSIYKILVNLRYGLRGLANGFKFIAAIVILIFCFQIYLQPSLVTRPVTQFDYGTFNPFEINSNSQSNGATTNNENNGGNQGIVIPSINPKPNINIHELETEIHNLINNERQKNGVATLQFDTKLSDIARSHSQDMAARNYFSHYTPEGDGPTERAIKAGYSVHKELGGGYYSDGIAENIFQNNLYDTVIYYNGIPVYDWNSQSEIANSTVNGWMNSPGHRQNILTSTYNNEGIGVSISSDDKVYITEDFW